MNIVQQTETCAELQEKISDVNVMITNLSESGIRVDVSVIDLQSLGDNESRPVINIKTYLELKTK